jgi:hypothetical protein
MRAHLIAGGRGISRAVAGGRVRRPFASACAAWLAVGAFSAFFAGAGSGFAGSAFAAPATPAATCGATFSVVPVPSPGSMSNELHDVVSIATSDVWAVGYRIDGANPPTTTTLHNDGSGWSVIPSADAGTPKNGQLMSVDATSATDVWAVGTYTDSKGNLQALIERWQGSAWSKVKAPGAGSPRNGSLGGIDARTASDAWAVGSYVNKQGIVLTLALRWDGQAWSRVPTPNPTPPGAPKNGGLGAVYALSATNAWAVGSYLDASALSQPLVEHWNGTAWSIVDTPDLGADEAVLTDVTALSSSAVWAVGFNDTSTLVERWDGSKWIVVDSPTPGSHHNANLSGITAIRAGDLWAAGAYVTDQPSLGTLVEHWNGSKWTVASSDNAPGDDSLAAIDGDGTEVWAVGNVFPPTGPEKNLALHRCPGL